MQDINNLVEIEHKGLEFFFEVEYNYDLRAYGGKITDIYTFVYGFDKKASSVYKEGEPVNELMRRYSLAVAWSGLRDEVFDIMEERIEEYVRANESEELEKLSFEDLR